MEETNFSKFRIGEYINFLLNWQKRINIISKKIGLQEINLLIKESLLLGEKIFSQNIIDAGTGSGILGIPIAIKWPDKRFIFVETTNKKIFFLNELIKSLNLLNIEVVGSSVQEFFQKNNDKNVALISRGFPNNAFLYQITLKKGLYELLIITSKHKIKNFYRDMENFSQNQYNIPWRNHLVIFKMENVSRETKDK